MIDAQKSQGMKILLVGSGGREHALAWKLSQSSRLDRLFIAPGNAGTAALGTNVSLGVEDIPGLVEFTQREKIDLVIVGPEAPLARGLADALQAAGVLVFGPTRLAARMETSKIFSKAFMERHGIPTARYAAFTDYELALRHLYSVDYPVVIKASGLAAGKGVLIPESREEAHQNLQDLMVDGLLGTVGHEVVIEERLEGEEVSLLAFTDGVTVRSMPPAQDHKRLLDGDQGPNTGGMGAYAPAPVCPPELAEELTHSIIQAAVDGLRSEGICYQGVLYAGLMLTADGPRVLEFNCRFGDPETQVLMPLLDSDLIDIAESCARGKLDQTEIRWKDDACACVVLASQGYPGKSLTGVSIQGLETERDHSIIFHAATSLVGGQYLTSGGRVLGITAWGKTLRNAIDRTRSVIGEIHFEGMQYRTDIGARGLRHPCGLPSAYAEAGVNIDAGMRAVSLMSAAVRSTYNPSVLGGIGSFGGMLDASHLKSMERPILVSSTDGIGTKIMVAAHAGRYGGLGRDIVNHCIDDILVQGARPLFFLDYFASSCLQPEIIAEIITGMADACREAGCVLIGGETAEMPGVYQENELDIAGTIVGLVEYGNILPKANLQAGDLLVGLRSSGFHTNGFSLLRRIFQDTPFDTIFPGMDCPLEDVLLEPHRSYLPLLGPALDASDSPVKALAHLTGGGIIDNLPRVLPQHLNANIRRGSWQVPPIFSILQEKGNVSDDEMLRVFNMGIGMVAVIAPENIMRFQEMLPEEAWVIGELAAGDRKIVFA